MSREGDELCRGRLTERGASERGRFTQLWAGNPSVMYVKEPKSRCGAKYNFRTRGDGAWWSSLLRSSMEGLLREGLTLHRGSLLWRDHYSGGSHCGEDSLRRGDHSSGWITIEGAHSSRHTEVMLLHHPTLVVYIYCYFQRRGQKQ